MKLKNLFTCGAFVLVTAFSTHVFAGPQKLGVGVERLAFLGGASLNTLHGQYEIMPESAVGASFGFNNDFDVIYLGGDFRHDLLKTNASALFAKANLGLASGVYGVDPAADADNSGFSAAALLGFEYALTGNFKVTMAYGFQFMFGLGDNKIGFTNNDAFGNFGLHWFL